MSAREPLTPARFTETDERWKARAACRDTPDPDAFFPFPGDVQGIQRATAVCSRCPVAGPCLAYGIATGSVGIFGGTTERQRARLRANRARRQARTINRRTERKPA